MSTNAAQEAENLEIEQVEARINADRNLNKTDAMSEQKKLSLISSMIFPPALTFQSTMTFLSPILCK